MTAQALDERAMLEGLLSRAPEWSRNRNYDAYATDAGKRVRRRAGFLRSVVRDVERARERKEPVMIERIERGVRKVLLRFEGGGMLRRVHLTEDEVSVLTRVFPLLAGLFSVDQPASATRSR